MCTSGLPRPNVRMSEEFDKEPAEVERRLAEELVQRELDTALPGRDRTGNRSLTL